MAILPVCFIVACVAVLVFGIYQDIREEKLAKQSYEDAKRANPPYFCQYNGWGYGSDSDPRHSIPVTQEPINNAPKSSPGMTGGWTW